MAIVDCLRSTLEVCIYFACWYGPSIGLTMFNKWFLTQWHGGFEYPILITTIHFAANSIWSLFLLNCFPTRFPEPDPQQITWKGYMVSIVPIGIATAVDIVLSNQAYLFVTVTLMTIIKSGSPIFILGWAFALRLEKPTIALVGVMIAITVGAMLAVVDFSGEVDSTKTDKQLEDNAAREVFGISLLVVAMFASGGRWACTQLVLQAGFTKMHPVVALRYTAPVCFLTLIVPCALIEIPGLLEHQELEQDWALTTIILILSSSLLAVVLILAEFSIISRYSAISLVVGGVVKEFLTIGTAIVFLDETLNWNQLVGAIIVIIAVMYYSYVKTTTKTVVPGLDQTTPFQRVQYASAPRAPIPKLELSISEGHDTDLDDLGPSRVAIFEIEHEEDEDTEAMKLLSQMCDQAHEHTQSCQGNDNRGKSYPLSPTSTKMSEL
eukprot:TRINITY_DN9094_c0_g1_i3.p1 TRINITY_DN9094_c0_g1~~TRINITY_DN9094_c0_g1_i3.p1  ORF type:complete len:437 (-),score=71.42 TRINITY_DN9094_c0_g1_i3:133-1443(-)